ncbi:MAG: outer membrane beta-barrel protein [Sedimentisphaerales bacterium]|nr:outer membrane beta-barrel protein [Sedimentisphaerales bacterium]
MTRYLMWLSVVGLIFAGVAGAAVRQGDAEVELQGSFMKEDASGDTGLDLESWSACVGLGYFVTDNLQLAVSGLGLWSDNQYVRPGTGTDSSYDIDLYGIGTKARWFFMPKNQWVPYLGAHLSYVDADITTKDPTRAPVKVRFRPEGVLWGPLAGLRFELNANNDFFVEYQYHVWDGDIGRVFEDGHAVFLGIVHKFGNIGNIGG